MKLLSKLPRFKLPGFLSLNDPNWGKRPQKPDGPPDLDEILRKFGQKLSGLFGGGGSNNGGNQNSNNGNNQPPNTGNSGGGLPGGGAAALGTVLIVALSIIVVGWLATGFYQVKEGSKAVVLRLGKYSTENGAGLHWRMPWPIESHETVDTTNLRTVTIGYRNEAARKENRNTAESLMLTSDENIVDVQFSIQYDVSDAKDFLFNNNMRSNAEEIIRQIGETAIREVIGKSKLDSVLNEGRDDIVGKVKTLVQEIANRYKLGIRVANLNLANLQPPEQVQKDFDDYLRAGKIRESLRNEGEAHRNDRVQRAKGTAQRLKEEADAYRGRVTANAEGDAQRFKLVLGEYEKAPQVTRERMYLETMQQIMSSTSKVFVDNKSGNSLLYLPLDKLVAQTLQDQHAAKPAAAESMSNRVDTSLSSNAPVVPLNAEPQSRRDQLRNR
jgi:modulator of FtsH protease HflK